MPTGLLVAFDSSTLHEVTPVAAGRRLSAVDWFY
jgi:predicted 2-oxoglutarate/Fe(II)-dependent dioxygenase YbiX